jgi:hypothetical protein
MPDPRQEEAVEHPLVAVDRGRLEPGRCECSQVLGCDFLENGPRLRLRRALFPRVFAPACGGPRRDEKGEPPPLLRPRRREHLHFRVATEPPMRSVRLCIDDVNDQPPLAAALHDAHCHGRTAFPRRVPPRPWVYHVHHHTAGPVHEGWSHTRQWRPSFRARMPSTHASTEPSGARLALRPMRRRSVIVGTSRIRADASMLLHDPVDGVDLPALLTKSRSLRSMAISPRGSARIRFVAMALPTACRHLAPRVRQGRRIGRLQSIGGARWRRLPAASCMLGRASGLGGHG